MGPFIPNSWVLPKACLFSTCSWLPFLMLCVTYLRKEPWRWILDPHTTRTCICMSNPTTSWIDLIGWAWHYRMKTHTQNSAKMQTLCLCRLPHYPNNTSYTSTLTQMELDSALPLGLVNLSDLSLSETSLINHSQAPALTACISLPPSCWEILAGPHLEPTSTGVERVTMDTLNCITPISLWQTWDISWTILPWSHDIKRANFILGQKCVYFNKSKGKSKSIFKTQAAMMTSCRSTRRNVCNHPHSWQFIWAWVVLANFSNKHQSGYWDKNWVQRHDLILIAQFFDNKTFKTSINISAPIMGLIIYF